MDRVVVPLYDSFEVPALEFICESTQMETIFFESAKIKEAIQIVKSNKCKAKYIICTDETSNKDIDEIKGLGKHVFKWTEFLDHSKNNNVEYQYQNSKLDDICIILHTSGSTGVPKGVCLTNRNLLLQMEVVQREVTLYGINNQNCENYSFLPYAHIFGLLVDLTTVHLNGTVN